MSALKGSTSRSSAPMQESSAVWGYSDVRMCVPSISLCKINLVFFAAKWGRQAIDDASTYVDRQREALEKRRDRLAAAVEAGKQAYREEKEKT